EEPMNSSEPSLARVAQGLGYVFVALALQLLIPIGLILLTAFLPALAPAVGPAVLLGLLLGLGLNLIGLFRCRGTPPETGARGVRSVALVLAVVAAPLFVALAALTLLGRSESFGWLLAGLWLLVLLLSLPAHLFFVVFLKRVAHFVGEGLLEVKAEKILAL